MCFKNNHWNSSLDTTTDHFWLQHFQLFVTDRDCTGVPNKVVSECMILVCFNPAWFYVSTSVLLMYH